MNKPLSFLAAIVSVVVMAFAAQGNTYTFTKAGDTQLRMLMAGNGGPAVVFENGLGEQLDLWRRTQAAISEVTTTIAYDRAGTGGSDDGALPRDAQQVAHELHEALQDSGVPPPYVLVGHSLGGLYVRVYASLYPREVAALVLVDPTEDTAADNLEEFAASTMLEVNGIPAAKQQARDAQIPAGLPVYLISAMGANGEPWFTARDTEARELREAVRVESLAAHTEWVNRLGNGSLIVTENSGHIVPVEESTLVIDTIRRVLDAL